MGRRFDADGYERRDAWMSTVECVECGKDVSLRAETEQWVLMRDGKRWRHDGYGPALGECCGLLYADGYEGVEVFVLQESNSAAPNASQSSTHNESAPEERAS